MTECNQVLTPDDAHLFDSGNSICNMKAVSFYLLSQADSTERRIALCQWHQDYLGNVSAIKITEEEYLAAKILEE